MRAAIYHRPEKETSPEDNAKQLNELEEFCKTKGFEIFQKYIEGESADGRQRPVFIQLMKDANKKCFDVVVVWSFRNFRKSSGLKDVKYITHLKGLGVRFVSYQEPFFDTSSHYADILSSMFEWIANEEAKTISERTKVGIEKAKRSGVVFGRPKLARQGEGIGIKESRQDFAGNRRES